MSAQLDDAVAMANVIAAAAGSVVRRHLGTPGSVDADLLAAAGRVVAGIVLAGQPRDSDDEALARIANFARLELARHRADVRSGLQ